MIKIRGIKKLIEDSGITKTFVMVKLGISRRTFYIRLNNEEFTKDEFDILKNLPIW